MLSCARWTSYASHKILVAWRCTTAEEKQRERRSEINLCNGTAHWLVREIPNFPKTLNWKAEYEGVNKMIPMKCEMRVETCIWIIAWSNQLKINNELFWQATNCLGHPLVLAAELWETAAFPCFISIVILKALLPSQLVLIIGHHYWASYNVGTVI